MEAVKIKDNIYWVGAIDWNLRNFHGYLTSRGSTYNAYLVIDDKITLIDTVKANLSDEMMKRISSIIDPSKIDYIISNHVEMDHSGALPVIKEAAPNAEIFTCLSGEKGLEAHYKKGWDYTTLKTGDTLNTGKYNFDFVTTPMVHWPDNMVAYLREEKILFSNDSFGQHLATAERFDDEFSLDIVIEEASKYYANIVMPYDVQVKKELEAAATLDIEMIAPSHGVIWRSNVKKIVEKYISWSNNEYEKKAIIVYDSMWGSTEKMAHAIQETFEKKGYHTAIYNPQFTHVSDILNEVLTAEYVCVGSPTLNSNMLPTVAGLLTYLSGLAPKRRKAISFGSYGWNGKSIDHVGEVLDKAGFDVVYSAKLQYIPSEDDMDSLREEIDSRVGG